MNKYESTFKEFADEIVRAFDTEEKMLEFINGLLYMNDNCNRLPPGRGTRAYNIMQLRNLIGDIRDGHADTWHHVYMHDAVALAGLYASVDSIIDCVKTNKCCSLAFTATLARYLNLLTLLGLCIRLGQQHKELPGPLQNFN